MRFPTTNRDRMRELQEAASKRQVPQRFQLGDRVFWRDPADGDEEGVIDCAYADLAAAIDAGAVPKGWYEMQTRTPRTPKSGRWYGVILEEGAVLGGEDDLEVYATYGSLSD